MRALIRERLTTYFQPIVHLDTGSVAGFEALARVIHPDGTVTGPGELIVKIERDIKFVQDQIRLVLKEISKKIVPLFERYPDFYISINIPPMAVGDEGIGSLFRDPKLVKHLGRLVIEMTERQALTPKGHRALQLGRQYGVRVAVDDFGTGHSGLAQIAGFDLDFLKIDRSLIAPVLTNRTSARMIRGLVALSAALRMRTIAEGVESGPQAFFLRAAGVDCGQGWFWSKAIPAEQVEHVLQKGFGPVSGWLHQAETRCSGDDQPKDQERP